MKPLPMFNLTHTQQHSSHFGVVGPGQCHGNRSTERLMSHREGHCRMQWAIYSQQTQTHTVYVLLYSCEDLSLATLIQPFQKPWSAKCTSGFPPRFSPSEDIWSSCKHSQALLFHCTNRRCTVCTAINLFECTWVCPCGVYECVPCAHLAEFRCAGSSCGLSAGGSHVPCRMRWLVLPRLSQEACRALSGLYQSDVGVNLC